MTKKEAFIIFIIVITGLFFLFTHDFWFLSQNKAIVAFYDKASEGYKIYYVVDGKIDNKPTWIIRSFAPLNKLYITDFDKNNWRLVEEQISGIKENDSSGRIESDLLQKISTNHKNNTYPEEIGCRDAPTGLKQLRKWLDRNILKELGNRNK